VRLLLQSLQPLLSLSRSLRKHTQSTALSVSQHAGACSDPRQSVIYEELKQTPVKKSRQDPGSLDNSSMDGPSRQADIAGSFLSPLRSLDNYSDELDRRRATCSSCRGNPFCSARHGWAMTGAIQPRPDRGGVRCSRTDGMGAGRDVAGLRRGTDGRSVSTDELAARLV